MTTSMLMSMIISILFPVMKHPLSMGIMLILQTLIIGMMTGLLINNFLFSYMLTMTVLSGMLVLFIYMASVASNEKFQSSIKINLITLMATFTTIVIFFLVDQLSSSSMWSTKKKIMMSNEHILSLVSMFNMHHMFVTMMMVSYLFFTMIVISTIVNVDEGPLRMKS